MKRLHACGFTLVEMLVAIGLMATMAIIAWRGLAFVANQRERVDQGSVQIAQLLRTFAQMERDVDQRLPDIAVSPRQTAPELPLAISVAADARGSELGILRTVPEPSGASHTLRVVYRLRPAGLVRDTGAGEVLMLPSAERFAIRLYAGGFWVEPTDERRAQPPLRATALELAVEDGKGGRYIKVIAL